MKYAYLAVFLSGLALAVHVMLHGVERWRTKHSDKPSAVLNPPTVAALAAGIGAGGYLLETRSSLQSAAVFLAALAIGVAAHFGMTLLMARWALRGGASVPPDQDINGQVATVSRDITPEHPGEISWIAWGTTHTLPAAGLSESTIPAGCEVVIDVVENGIARVELWSVVESRL